MLLIALVLFAVMVFGFFGFVVLFGTGRAQKKAEASAPEILDAQFDGRRDVTVHMNMRTLKYDTVVLGAKDRGYKLTSQASNQYGPTTLVFERAHEG